MDYSTDEQRYKENLERIAKYRPLDDDFMRLLFKNNTPLAELVLRIITGKYDLKIIRRETQYDIKLAGARSVCLDVFAVDSEGRQYNLEIQRDDEGAQEKRARYHSSAMDVHFLGSGDDFDKLPITYVIFITENDVRGEGRPLYHFEMRDIESGKPFGDGKHIIYLNAAYNKEGDNSDIAKLAHDFRCSDADDMMLELMASETGYYKNTPEGVSAVCKINEEMCEKEAARAKKKALTEVAKNLLAKNSITVEDIADVTGLSLNDVKKLEKEIKSAAI